MRAGCTAMTQRPQERHCGACRAALYITACSPPSSALISRTGSRSRTSWLLRRPPRRATSQSRARPAAR